MTSTEKQPSAPPDQSFPTVYPNPHFTGGTFPPPGPYPPYFAFPPPPDGGQGESTQGGSPPHPYMMYPPHGMVYAYQPHAGQAVSPLNQGVPSAISKPKRRQVKMACTNCAAACKRCDEARPCERCIKYGITDSCVDGQRKERKKGIKRGPYKRKNKGIATDEITFTGQPGEGEWNPNSPPSTATTSAAIHAVAQFAPPPEGYHPYPYFYPPPPGFIPPSHEGQPSAEGNTGNANGQPQPMLPYYVHPGGYPPFGHYPPQPGAAFPPPPQTLDPAEASKKAGDAGSGPNGEEAKKRTKTSKSGETKTKKPKNGATGRAQKGKKRSGVEETAPEPVPESDGPV